jgi:hypothetical protein
MIGFGMEFQHFLNLAVGATLSVLGWFARQLWSAVQDLKKDLTAVEIALPTHYVRKEELETRLDKLEAILNRIYEKLDSKADKD